MVQTGSIEIKRLLVEDIDRFKETIVQFIYESNVNCVFTNQYSLDDATVKWNDLYNHVLNDKAVLYGCIMTENGIKTLIGFVWAYEYPFREDVHRLYVSILHVHENFRSIGVGKKLMFHLENYACTMGYNAIYMHAEGINDKGIKFYNREGYETERVQLVKKLI